MRRSFVKGFALRLSVVLVMLSFQVNLLGSEAPLVPLVSYAVVFACFAVLIGRRLPAAMLPVLIVPVVVAAAFVGPLKGLGLGIGACLGFLAVRNYEHDYRTVMVWLMAITLGLVVVQFLGITESVYRFSYYGSEAQFPIPITDPQFGTPNYLPQFRPSGIFPSPTYVSAFTVLLYSTVLSSASGVGRVAAVVSGVLFALLGSSVGAVLVFSSLLVLRRRPQLGYLVAAYAIAMLLYAHYLPVQFDYSYGVREFTVSVMGRLDLQDGSQESVLQRNWAVVAILVIVSLAFFIAAVRFGSLAVMLPPASAVALPILVHDITLSMFYWFLMGAVIARVKNDGLLESLKSEMHDLRRRRKRPGASGVVD